MPVTADIQFSMTGRHTTALDLGTAALPFALSAPLAFTNGTGANQVDRVFTDSRTLAASANEDLDLAAGLTDAYGNAITFAEIVAIGIKASSGNTNKVRVTRPASNGFPLYLAAGDGEDVPPGGFIAKAAPDAAGWGTVTPGTADLINIANGGAGTPVTYEIVILGRSA
jgi:hypothetical protein